MRKSRIAFAAVLACGWATGAWGQQVAGYYGGSVSDSSTNPGTLIKFPNDNNLTTFSGSAPFTASASASTDHSSASLALSADTANGNIGLHGSATAAIGGVPGFLSPGYATDGFDLYEYDTFQIGGPAGAAEQFQYNLTLNGSVSGTTVGGAIDAYGALQLFSDSNWEEPGTVIPFTTCNYGLEASNNPCGMLASVYLTPNSSGGTVTGILTLIGGTTVQLGDLLWARASAGNAVSESSFFDASDTGFFTLTPITPGASFTTASGLSYAASPEAAGAVPEPSTWGMMLLGFGVIGAAMRRQNRQPQSRMA
jgi:hypothetical protein